MTDEATALLDSHWRPIAEKWEAEAQRLRRAVIRLVQMQIAHTGNNLTVNEAIHLMLLLAITHDEDIEEVCGTMLPHHAEFWSIAKKLAVIVSDPNSEPADLLRALQAKQ